MCKDIEQKIEQHLNNSAEELLADALEEIKRLKQVISKNEVSNRYQFGQELKYILRGARPCGFRFVYADHDTSKKANAETFIHHLSQAVGFKYDKSVTEDLILEVKDYTSIDLLR